MAPIKHDPKYLHHAGIAFFISFLAAIGCGFVEELAVWFGAVSVASFIMSAVLLGSYYDSEVK